MARERTQRQGLVWAWAGGAVFLLGVIAIVIGAVVNQHAADSTRRPSTAPTETARPSAPADPERVVDETVADLGWVPEPITADPDLYIRRALEAAATFDTQLADREDWLTYLDSWFTPDTRYSSELDQQEAMETAQLELRQSVVLPADEWASLLHEAGRVVATASEIAYVDVVEDPQGDMRIGTADVILTFTRIDGDGAEYESDAQVRVSVQVLCGEGSVPAPGSGQMSGDCKVVRYFAEPMEP